MGKLWATLAAIVCWTAVLAQAQTLYLAAGEDPCLLYTIDPIKWGVISTIRADVQQFLGGANLHH
jgi:hypothetical protein